MDNDIDLIRRKNIIREELSKLLGAPVEREKRIEQKRLKQKKFDRKKIRLKMRKESQRKNIGR